MFSPQKVSKNLIFFYSILVATGITEVYLATENHYFTFLFLYKKFTIRKIAVFFSAKIVAEGVVKKRGGQLKISLFSIRCFLVPSE